METNIKSAPNLQLESAIRTLPAFQTSRMRGEYYTILETKIEDSFFTENPEDAPLRILLNIIDECPQKGTPPLEQVIVYKLDSIIAVYEFPYGTLLNITLDIIDNIAKENKYPNILKTEEQARVAFEPLYLKRIVNDLVTNEVKISPHYIRILFNAVSYLPSDETFNKEIPCQYYIGSLADALFNTLYHITDIYKNGATIKRCKTCSKIFFAKHANQKHCYFTNPDETLNGMSCEQAIKTRRSREESTKGTVNNTLRNMRNKYASWNTKAPLSGKAPPFPWSDFEHAYDNKLKELENDPWMNKKLLEWLKAYDESHAYDDKKGTSK